MLFDINLMKLRCFLMWSNLPKGKLFGCKIEASSPLLFSSFHLILCILQQTLKKYNIFCFTLKNMLLAVMLAATFSCWRKVNYTNYQLFSKSKSYHSVF